MTKIFAWKVSEFPASGTLLLQGKDIPIALFRVVDKFYATEELCPHRGGPLSEGKLEDGCVTCPWHQGKFEVSTGKVLSGPVNRPLKRFHVIREGDDLFVGDPC